MNVWPNRRWRGANGMAVENIDLWKRLRKEVSNSPIRIDIAWVKAHKGNKHNRAADKLAKESASKPFRQPLSVTETTRKWSDRKTKRGCVPIYGQEIKIRIISREYKKHAKAHEYRYEVIDPNDESFKELDFIWFENHLSRNQCVTVRLNSDQKVPRIEVVVEELEPSEYKF